MLGGAIGVFRFAVSFEEEKTEVVVGQRVASGGCLFIEASGGGRESLPTPRPSASMSPNAAGTSPSSAARAYQRAAVIFILGDAEAAIIDARNERVGLRIAECRRRLGKRKRGEVLSLIEGGIRCIVVGCPVGCAEGSGEGGVSDVTDAKFDTWQLPGRDEDAASGASTDNHEKGEQSFVHFAIGFVHVRRRQAAGAVLASCATKGER